MNELIRMNEAVIGSERIQTVNARELHEFLESKQDFSDWIKKRINKYGFLENSDFTVHKIMDGKKGQFTPIDYHLSLDMAKQLSMVENNEQGRKARQYFIEVERQFKEKNSNVNAIAKGLFDMAVQQIRSNEIEKIRLENENKILRLFAPKCGLDKIGQDEERQKIRRGSEVKNSGKGRPMSLVFNVMLQPQLPFNEINSLEAGE